MTTDKDIHGCRLGRRAEDKQSEAITRLMILAIRAGKDTREINDIIQLLVAVKPHIG